MDSLQYTAERGVGFSGRFGYEEGKDGKASQEINSDNFLEYRRFNVHRL